MNTHKKINKLLTAFALGELSQQQLSEAKAHMAECSLCSNELKRIKALLKRTENIRHLSADEKMCETAKRAVFAAVETEQIKPSPRPNTSLDYIWRIIMKSPITKLAAAAVIAIALLVPLSYGMSNIIKKLIAGSVEYDDYQGDFTLGSDIRVEMEVGTKELKNVVSARNIKFFVKDDELKGTLRCSVRCQPKYKWMTTIELSDSQEKILGHTQHVNENGGVETSYPSSFARDIHFTVGRWSNISQVQKFRVCFEKVPEKIKATPDAWVESSELDVVHGRVTGTDGKPIANAVIQIRQKRKPGQGSIIAPDLITDEQGYYSYDGIKWPYSVGVLFYETDASGQYYKHQYKRLNKDLDGSQTVNFEFDTFPTGSAAIFGKAESPDGQAIKEFSVDIRLAVDFEDYSQEYLYQFGYRKPFATKDGRFEISDLPAGVYNVTIYPTNNEILKVKEIVGKMSYVCELKQGQRLEIGAENAREKIFYGRVLFENGTPAVPDLEGFETQIVAWGKNYTAGVAIATVDGNGYFAAPVPDEGMEQFKSGKAWLKVSIGMPLHLHHFEKGETFPVELLSPERDKAGVLKIKRPNVYYGRILYENGKPAVPEVLPWQGAKVYVNLRYAPANSKDRGVMERINDVDNEGYFASYLTDEEIEQIKAGNYTIQIYHPLYEQMNVSAPIVSYPFEMLSKDKKSVKGYKILFDEIKSQEFENLCQILESIEKIKELFAALKTYANSHQGNYPGTLRLLDVNDNDSQWLVENVQYLSGTEAQDKSKPAETVLAYDKLLLEKYGSTLVLFRDGHIEFCWPRQLEILGIN